MLHRFTLLLLPLLATALSAHDWPQFRGPGAQGHSPARQVPTHWSPTENVAWKTPIPGKGWSSPVHAGGKLFLTSALDQGDGTQTLHALCLDTSTGRILWNQAVFQRPIRRIHKKNSHASATPLIDQDRVFIHFGAQGTACLNLDGSVRWKNEDIDYEMVHGNGGSPVLAGDKLIFNCDGKPVPFVIALDADTGAEAWRIARKVQVKKPFSFATPLLLGELLVSPGSGAVIAYQVDTGQEVWRARYGEGYSVIPRPVTGHNMIFLSSGYDSPTCLGIQLGGQGDVTDTHVKWIRKKAAPHTPSMLLVDDMLFTISDIGIASCLDPLTGKPHWQERVGGQHSASPILAEGRIYFQDERGKATIIQAARDFRVVATNDLKEYTLSSYAVDDHTLYIRTASKLYRIGKPAPAPR